MLPVKLAVCHISGHVGHAQADAMVQLGLLGRQPRRGVKVRLDGEAAEIKRERGAPLAVDRRDGDLRQRERR